MGRIGIKSSWSILNPIFSVSYSDKENDVITLSSQVELDDFYNQIKGYDLSAGYKFNLVIFTPIREYTDEGDYADSSPDFEEQGARNICPTQ